MENNNKKNYSDASELLDAQIIEQALDYHRLPKPGKTQVVPTKTFANQIDASLAYTPGVAAPCIAIANDPLNCYQYTNRGNLVAVVSDGTAVLGLGNIGPSASKPVMEGKAVLFKKFAGIDVFDIELQRISSSDNRQVLDQLVNAIVALEPTFGGINLEDIKSPDCFYIEQTLKQKMKIPVFHDDQHGTAIVVVAGLVNALKIVDKSIDKIKIVSVGAGAASIACLDMLVLVGAQMENIYVSDSVGLLTKERYNLHVKNNSKPQNIDKKAFDITEDYINNKYRYINNNAKINNLLDAMRDADVVIGLSQANTINQEMIRVMNHDPIIFVLSNPTPEIMPEEIHAVRADAIIATGRSDYPNQINNALCFPYIFRGALDVGATCINDAMKIAAINAIAKLATENIHDLVVDAYGNEDLMFSKSYIIPKLLDPRLIKFIAPAVAIAAMQTNVAIRPINDMNDYLNQLNSYIYKTNVFMQPIFSVARKQLKRVVLSDGEDRRVILAMKEVIDLKLAKITLIGRPFVIQKRIEQLNLKLLPGVDFEIINNEMDSRFKEYWMEYYAINKYRGVSIEQAKKDVISDTTIIGAITMRKNYADAMICGVVGDFKKQFNLIANIIGYDESGIAIDDVVNLAATVNVVMLPRGNIFIADTGINDNPTAEQIAKITIMASKLLLKFGIQPKIALLSHSSFGTDLNSESAIKMRKALSIIRTLDPKLEIDGEMQGDVALVPHIRNSIMPDSVLSGVANLLIMPNIEAANISYNLLRSSASGIATIGPILIGIKQAAHIMNSHASVRSIVNMIALASA